jgi:hypothetical protein
MNGTDILLNTIYYENRELELLKNAMDIEAKKRGERIAQNPIMKNIIDLLEKFIHDKKLVCYGGTAINNILPKEDQFYNRNIEIPDYDFFSPNAMNDAKELADIYFKQGFSSVEAKAGVHYGTYKVFVNFFQIADITQIDSKLFSSLKKNAISKEGILYCPPNFLRMAMYLELSRPSGDITRWEKVLKRLNLLNKNYPLKATGCDPDTFAKSLSARSYNKQYFHEKDKIQDVIKNVAASSSSSSSSSSDKLVLIGGYAFSLYSRYLKNQQRDYLNENPVFDILSISPDKTAKLIKDKLEEADIRDVSIEKKPSVSEYLSTHFEIKVGSQPVVYLYKPLACHSYNTIKVDNKIYRVATIDTMLSFYLLFLYIDRPYFNPKRILCMCEYLFKIQQKNRLKLRGILRRFSVSCYGKQKTIEDIRNEKAEQFKRLKNKRKSREFEKWFLRYNPESNSANKPFIEKNKPKKTNEDIINEAKLAFEAKAIASNAIINQIEKIQKEKGGNASMSTRKNIQKQKKTRKSITKQVSKTGKPYMQTIPVMIEASIKSRNNKTLRQKIPVSKDKYKDKEVENILYLKDIITPSSLSTPVSTSPDDSVNVVFSRVIQ